MPEIKAVVNSEIDSGSEIFLHRHSRRRDAMRHPTVTYTSPAGSNSHAGFQANPKGCLIAGVIMFIVTSFIVICGVLASLMG